MSYKHTVSISAIATSRVQLDSPPPRSLENAENMLLSVANGT